MILLQFGLNSADLDVHLSDNMLSGALPDSWGSPGVCSQHWHLQRLTVMQYHIAQDCTVCMTCSQLNLGLAFWVVDQLMLHVCMH